MAINSLLLLILNVKWLLYLIYKRFDSQAADLEKNLNKLNKGNAMKCVTNKSRNKLVIIIDFRGEMVGLITPKHFDSKAACLVKKFKKLDKGMIWKAIERKK